MTNTTVAEKPVVEGLERGDLHDLYYYLQLTREVEQVLSSLYRQNKVIGGLYRSLGQEGTAVGAAWAMKRREDGTGDVMAPAIRNLGAMFVLGAEPVAVMRQYMAKADSPTSGREQNLHFTDFHRGWIGAISHLGTSIEILAGCALSFKLRGEPRVALGFIGDGATSTGAFHEGFNFAAVQRAPLVIIIENNCYAYTTPIWKQTAAASFVDKAAGYGVAGEKCDGNDLLAVYQMTKRALDRARSGGGASLLEVMTYRRKGHAEHDAQQYVPAAELLEWEGRDPLTRFEAQLLENGWADRAELDAIIARVHGEVDTAREAAEASPLPEPETALADHTGNLVYGDQKTNAPWTRNQPLNPKLA